MTPEQSAGLTQARLAAMAALRPGEDQASNTPIEDRPGYMADDAAYLDDVLAKWLAANPDGDVAATRERALNSWAALFTNP